MEIESALPTANELDRLAEIVLCTGLVHPEFSNIAAELQDYMLQSDGPFPDLFQSTVKR